MKYYEDTTNKYEITWKIFLTQKYIIFEMNAQINDMGFRGKQKDGNRLHFGCYIVSLYNRNVSIITKY